MRHHVDRTTTYEVRGVEMTETYCRSCNRLDTEARPEYCQGQEK